MKMAGVVALAALFLVGKASAQTSNSFTGTVSALQVGGDAMAVPGSTTPSDDSFSFAITSNGSVVTLCTGGNNSQRGAVVAGAAGVTGEGLKLLYATVLTAYTTGRTVTVYINTTATTPGWGCPVYAVDLGS
jgi:hypothetical protein